MAKCCDRDDDGDGNCPWHPDGVALEDIQTAPSPEPVTDVENCVIFGEADPHALQFGEPLRKSATRRLAHQ